MKARTLVMAAALAASLIGVSQSVASAAAPTPVVINAHPCQFAPVEIGPASKVG